MARMIRQFRPALVMVAILTAVLGLGYPLVVTAVGQLAFSRQADGSLVEVDGEVVGSSLLGQQFAAPEYFHPRPSAAGEGYDGAASSGSNLGPNNADLLDAVAERVAAYRAENDLADDAAVPVDAVTASGSGLDPHISVANARIQATRVAAARGLDVATVDELITEHTAGRQWYVLGEPAVNVLELNLALDAIGSGESPD